MKPDEEAKALFRLEEAKKVGKLIAEAKEIKKIFGNKVLFEKSSLLLMIREGCEVLILDEPTNHMDLHVREQLEETLKSYTGTLILVTHDRYMLEQLCDKLLIFENKQVKRYEGSVRSYEEHTRNKEQNIGLTSKEIQKKVQNKILLENQIAYLLGTMSRLAVDSEEYKQLMKLRG